MENRRIILFDGVCNLCNASVQYIIRRDPDMKFKFASLQSEIGMQLLEKYRLSTEKMNSIVLIENGKIYTRSTAVLRIARQLIGPVKLMYVFVIVPFFIRDAVYQLIARKRYKWFGRRDRCMVPGKELLDRFEV